MLTMETTYRGQGSLAQSWPMAETHWNQAIDHTEIIGRIEKELELTIWTEIGRKVLAEIDRVPQNIKQ